MRTNDVMRAVGACCLVSSLADSVLMWLGAYDSLSETFLRGNRHSVAWPYLPHPWRRLL